MAIPKSSALPYLKHYAEAEQLIAQDITGQWDFALCIPAYMEGPEVLKRLLTIKPNIRLLTILIINAPQSASAAAIEQSATLLLACEVLPLKQRLTDNISLRNISDKQDLLVLDYLAPDKRLPDKQGVGLARKIVFDLALALYAKGAIKSAWIFCTDADVVLPEDYFRVASMPQQGVSALLFPFQHTQVADQRFDQAQQLYDFSLYYYVEALKFSGSAYAFHTIGSTLCINAEAYCKVRGFPKRAGAEDFYLLNKLRKVGAIISLKEPEVLIETRASLRVPFGTGPAVNDIMSMAQPLEEYTYYHPDCFYYLQAWLHLIPKLWQCQQWEKLVTTKLHGSTKINANALLNILQTLHVDKALKHADKQNLDKNRYLKHMQDWFDAFMTLKFIHAARDTINLSVGIKDRELANFVEDINSQTLRLRRQQVLHLS